MGRPAKIHREVALRKAMKVFWSRGYSATTLDDIQKAIGLQRGSLYSYFGSKENLFREALSLYQIEVVKIRRDQVLAAKSAMAGIELFFKLLIDHSVAERKFPGCLNTNTAAELSVIDPNIAAGSRAGLKSWEEFWTQIIDRAKAEGAIAADKNSRVLARILITMTQGLNVIAKVNPDRAYLTSIVKEMLAALHV